MQLLEFKNSEITKDQLAQVEHVIKSSLPKEEIVLFDFSNVKSILPETLDHLEILVDRLQAVSGNEFIVFANADFLKTLGPSRISKSAKNVVQIKENPIGSVQYNYKSFEHRLFLTLQTSAVEAVQELCNLECLCEEVHADQQLFVTNKHVARLDLNLDHKYILLFSMADNDLIAFVSIVMQELCTEIQEMMLDWPAEIANHTCTYLRMLWGTDLDKYKQSSIPRRIEAAEVTQIRDTSSLSHVIIVENDRFHLAVELRKA